MKIREISEHLNSLNLKDELHARLNLFHDLCAQPATGTCIEGLLYGAMKKAGVDVSWSPMSHCQEKDLIFKIGDVSINVSIKGCKESKTRISFSSYRTTSAATLSEKMDLIEKLDSSLDVMLIFSRYHSNKNVLPDYYKVYLLDPHFLNPKNFQWKEDRNKDGGLKAYRTCLNDLDTNMGIVENMSGQLWVDTAKINMQKNPSMLLELMEITIQK
jgi:hypothetical protein